MKTYTVNEIFGPTLQGEGARKGTVNHWVRFAGCNLTCRADGPEGFDCDTDFSSGYPMTAEEIVHTLERLESSSHRVVLSGGEPGLQVDNELIEALLASNWIIAIETNGTVALPIGIQWVSCSPKTAEHTLRVRETYAIINELRYVRNVRQAIPKPNLKAVHHFISPAFEPDGTVLRETLDWCVKLCLENPRWALSTQDHKLWRVR